MARERGFVVEVTAFIPIEGTSAQEMAAAAVRVDSMAGWLHGQGFSAVAVSSRFTSRKVEGTVDVLNDSFPAANPMPDLDDSKFPTNSGTPIGADASAALDIPPELDRRVRQIT